MEYKKPGHYLSKTIGYTGMVFGTLLTVNGLINHDLQYVMDGFASFSAGALIFPLKEEKSSQKKTSLENKI